MTVTLDYSVADVTALPGLVTAAVQSAPSIKSYLGFSKGAALQFALSMALPAEMMTGDAGIQTINTTALATALGGASGTDLSGVLPALGGAASLCNASWPADPRNPQNNKEACAVYYLAVQRTIRWLAESTRPPQTPPDVGPILLQGESNPTGNVGFIPVVAYFVVAGVAALAVAAYAWVKHDDAVETARAQCAIEVHKITVAAQVQMATQLAEQAMKNGQTVNIPDVISSIGAREHADMTWNPWILGGGVALLGGLAAYGYTRRKGRLSAGAR